jgi:uncharacterized protein YbaP (TraB family)
MVYLLAAAALAAAPAAAPTGVAPGPAMFVVRDADTTVYLFGTFHALDGRAHWFDSRVRDAFDRSGELILETLVPEDPAQRARVGNAIPAPSVAPSASFLATTRMALSAGRSQGMQVDNGADMVLRHAAEDQGKAVEGLETLEFQLNMFNRMPATMTAQAKPAALGASGTVAADSTMQSLTRTMADMQSAWKRGDQTVFIRMLGQLQSNSPDTYRMMFTERNARWADWIAARMQTPGTVFVAVGAGHLAGRDSVLVRLAEKGIESQRVY